VRGRHGSFNAGDGRTLPTYGALSVYPDSGYDLGAPGQARAEGEGEGSQAKNSSGGVIQEVRYARQTLDILDPAATACGAPCQAGLRGLALAEWLDGSTRAVVLTMATYAPSLNALVAIKAVVEFGAGGGAVIWRQALASPLLPWPSGAPSDLEILVLAWGLVHMVLQAVLAVYALHWEKKAKRGAAPEGSLQRPGLRFPPEARRRPGKARKLLLSHFSRGWPLVDVVACGLVLGCAGLRCLAALLADSLGAKQAALASGGGGLAFADAWWLMCVHSAADSLAAAAAVLVWSRAIFKYLPTVRWLRAPALGVLRVLMPLFALAVAGLFAVMGAAHVALLLWGAHNRRFSSLRAALGTVVRELAGVLELEVSGTADAASAALRPPAPGGQWLVSGRQRELRGGASATEGWWFILCLQVGGLVVGSWVVAAVVRALQEEMRKSYIGASRPWLFEGALLLSCRPRGPGSFLTRPEPLGRIAPSSIAKHP